MSTVPPSYVDIPSRLKTPTDALKFFKRQLMCQLRVAMPGIVQSFDSSKQTVVVQIAVRENILQNLVPVPTDVAPLLDVPVVMQRGGGFSVTLPVKAGDECLIVFADMCINSWWQNGGTKNTQERRRRHSLSDAFAILGPWSQPRVLSNYSTNSLQFRSDDGSTIIDVSEAQVTVTPDAGTSQIKIVPGEIDLVATTVKINGKVFLTHQHTGVQTGAGNTGTVL